MHKHITFRLCTIASGPCVHYNDTQTSSVNALVVKKIKRREQKKSRNMHLINYLMRLSCHSRWYQRFRSTIQHMCLDRILMHLERFIMRKIDHFSQATCSFFYMKIMQFFRLSIKINWIDIAYLQRLCCTQALIHFQRIILIAMIHLVFVRNIYHSLLCSHHHFLFIFLSFFYLFFYILLTLTRIIQLWL